jgi:hypothetical protein
MTSGKDLEEHSVAYLKIGYCLGIGLERRKLRQISITVSVISTILWPGVSGLEL